MAQEKKIPPFFQLCRATGEHSTPYAARLCSQELGHRGETAREGTTNTSVGLTVDTGRGIEAVGGGKRPIYERVETQAHE